MCLAVPGKVVALLEEHGLPMAKVSFDGVTRTACLAHVPDTRVGDYVLVHVGFALQRIDEAEAEKMLALLRELGESLEDDA